MHALTPSPTHYLLIPPPPPQVKLDVSTPKLSARGPVLIESNCRLHGIEGSWKPIVDACFGYSQVSCLLDAYFDPAAFAALPTTPSKIKASGAQVHGTHYTARVLAFPPRATCWRLP